MKSTRVSLPLVLLALLVALPARAQLQISSQDGKNSIKFGLLAQPQGEWIDTADGEHTSQNLFLRRLRLLFGGKFGDKVSFFVESDSPNLGKADATGTKNTGDMYLQDAYLSYAFKPSLMVDAGMLLMPLSHNSQQGATTLLPIDYGTVSFIASTPTGQRVGRDYGAQLRGYFLKNHLEFRGAVTQGVRGTTSSNPLRTTLRAVWYPFEAETGFFYTGTNFGKKKIVAVGASYDGQADYSTTDADLYIDVPVGKSGNAATLQVDYMMFDGGKLVPSLPEQDTIHFEASYYFHGPKLGPFAVYDRRNYDEASRADEKFSQLGLAWWGSGHNFNVKLGAGKIEKDGAKDRNQIQLQCQLFFF